MNGTENIQKEKWVALGGTILFHGLLFVLFLLVIFKTPIPPFPDTGGNGIEVNFGTSDDGMGTIQPEEASNPAENVSTAEEVSLEPMKISTPVRPVANKILTQETEEAPPITSTNNTEIEKNTAAEEPKPEPRKPKAAALYPGKKTNGGSTSQGEGETQKSGDQGSKDGSHSATYHGPGGGTGNAPGNGTDGNGGDGRGGPRYSLTNRKAASLPVPRAAFQEAGKVVVEITVDNKGNVIKAKPGVKGSTTSNPTLLDIAQKAALNAKFNASADAPEEQKGTITYNFILK